MIEGGRIVFANPRTTKSSATRRANRRRLALELIAEEDRNDVGSTLQHGIRPGQGRRAQLQRLRKDGGLVDIGARATLAVFDDKPMILAVAQDVGERKKAQEEFSATSAGSNSPCWPPSRQSPSWSNCATPTPQAINAASATGGAFGDAMNLPEDTITDCA